MKFGQLRASAAAALLVLPAYTTAQTRTAELFEALESAPEPVGILRVDLLEDALVAGEPWTLSLRLAPGRAVSLRALSRESAWGGGWVWTGTVAGDPLGSATFSVIGDVVAGSLRIGRELWAIEPARPGLHRLRQVDEDALPACGGAVAVAPADLGQSLLHAPANLGGTSFQTIDVLVLYTVDAANAEGGTGPIEAKINLAVAETNQAYANSQVNQRLRLVHQTIAASYDETGDFNTELDRLRVQGDGFLDEAHALRNQYCADFVVLIVAGTQYCGIGYLMQVPDVSFESYAFSVTSRVCATGYYTFGHELGHNMGCHHDRFNATVGSYPFSYGYRTPDNQWRTVMAYAPGTRVQMFSNPNVQFAGQAMGIADPSPNSAENWKSLNLTAPVVADFRPACPGTWLTYCSAGTTSNGCVASISAAGAPSASAGSGFTLTISVVEGQKQGIVFYGLSGRNQSPWGAGSSSYLCMLVPTQRMGVQNSGGNFSWCDGSLSQDWCAFVASDPGALGAPFSSGQAVQTQAWFRDPGSPKTTSLSDALEFIVAP